MAVFSKIVYLSKSQLLLKQFFLVVVVNSVGIILDFFPKEQKETAKTLTALNCGLSGHLFKTVIFSYFRIQFSLQEIVLPEIL